MQFSSIEFNVPALGSSQVDGMCKFCPSGRINNNEHDRLTMTYSRHDQTDRHATMKIEGGSKSGGGGGGS